MSLARPLVAELDHEMTNTRRVLERVPEDRPDYKPHPKSMTLARLAGHVAELPGFGAKILKLESFDFRPPGGAPFQPRVMASRAELLDLFDRNVREVRDALAEASDEHLRAGWTLLRGGQALFSGRRIVALRTMMMNHIIHHRAQLGVYLRLNDVPLPALYGPTADEGGM